MWEQSGGGMSPPQRSEAGQITAFVTVAVLALVLMAGLVVDGGRLIVAKRRANNRAEQAARAGAQAVSVDAIRSSGAQVLDEDQAVAAAQDFLARAGGDGTVSVSGDSVTVTVDVQTSMLILGAAGLADKTVTGTATARNVRGVEEPET